MPLVSTFRRSDRHRFTRCTGCGPGDASEKWRGTATIFRSQEGNWSLGSCMTARTGGSTPGFGACVALLDERLAIGATYDATGGPFAGAAYLYEFSEGLGFRESAYFTAPNACSNDVFGYPVALAPGLLVVGAVKPSGKQLSVDAPPELEPSDRSGAAYTFSIPEP